MTCAGLIRAVVQWLLALIIPPRPIRVDPEPESAHERYERVSRAYMTDPCRVPAADVARLFDQETAP
jgi:hypothetical protein